jgi:hypothetical protein
VPKPIAAASTSVAITKQSTPTACASSAPLRSLSSTASTPRSVPFSRTIGIPPPPAAITTAPADTSSRIVATSRISSGSGDGTTRRQPRSPRDSQFSPAAIRSRASTSVSQRPIGLVGRCHAGRRR